MSSTQEESSRTSLDSLAQSSSLPRDSIITYSDDIGDSSVLGTSIVTYNNNEKLRNAPSSKQSDTSPFYHRKRFWAMCVAVNVVLSAIFIPLLYLVIIPSIAQSTINKSKLQFQSIIITNEKNDSFTINTKGETTEAGPFSAKLEFNGPVTVSFNDKVLGSTEIGDISVSKGSGSVLGTSQKFDIKDNPQFTEFASTTLSAESFKWTIDGIVNVRTFGTKIKNLNLHKEVIIPGSNGYNTSLVDLKINQNPDKTLSLEMTTNLYNPSPIAIEIGDMYLQILYNGTTIANAVAKNVFINSKENILPMTAISQLPTTDEDRFNFIKVISGYLTNTPVSTEAKILSIISPNGYVGWLNDAAKNLHLVTKIGQAKAPQLITGIDFGEMNIKFTPDAPYSPTISAKGATASLTMPFNIDFNVLSVSQNITLFAQGKPIATIVTPQTNVTTTVTNNGTVINLDIPETQMNVDNDSEDIFSEFFLNLTTGIGTDANVVGISNALVSTVIGDNIPLEGLPFNITTTLQGFNQFNSDGSPPSVNNVTILAGTSSNELIIGAVVTLTNPTRYSTSVGQVTFNLFYREQQIGNIVIQDLTVVPGPNPLTVVITLTDPENNAGKEIMTAFLLNQPISLEIRGFEGSTNIASLVPTFKAIDITTTLPSAPQQLISGTKLLIDNQTSTPNGVVDLANNFVAPISIYTMNSSFSFNEYTIGTYGQDMTNNPIFIPGNSVQRLQLPVIMNYDLAGSFSMLRTLALKNNLDVSVLDSLIVLSKVDVPGVDPTNVQPPTPEAIKSFDLGKFVTTALTNIPVTINLESRVAVGYYFMSISYQQSIVVETDSSIVSLIPKLAEPMIKELLGQSQMNINLIYLHDIDVSSFNIYMNGLISNTGPLPAVVNFPNGIDISSSGVALGKIVNIQPITVDPLAGAKLDGSSRFEIADVPTFTSFMASLFGGSAITGDMSGDAVITSFGAQIGPIPIKQSISVGGLSNNFQDGSKVVGLTLTAGGFEAKVALNNPSMFGVELGKIVFDIFNESEQVSTITGDNVVIVPNNVSIITLDGTLNSQIIQSVVAKTPLTIQGESITPPKATGEVVWLTEPFKSIKINAPFDLSQLTPAAPAS